MVRPKSLNRTCICSHRVAPVPIISRRLQVASGVAIPIAERRNSRVVDPAAASRRTLDPILRHLPPVSTSEKMREVFSKRSPSAEAIFDLFRQLRSNKQLSKISPSQWLKASISLKTAASSDPDTWMDKYLKVLKWRYSAGQGITRFDISMWIASQNQRLATAEDGAEVFQQLSSNFFLTAETCLYVRACIYVHMLLQGGSEQGEHFLAKQRELCSLEAQDISRIYSLALQELYRLSERKRTDVGSGSIGSKRGIQPTRRAQIVAAMRTILEASKGIENAVLPIHDAHLYLNACSQDVQDCKQAIALLQQLEACNVVPTRETFQILLFHFLDANRLDKAKLLSEEARRRDLNVGLDFQVEWAHYLVKRGRFQLAYDAFQSLGSEKSRFFAIAEAGELLLGALMSRLTSGDPVAFAMEYLASGRKVTAQCVKHIMTLIYRLARDGQLDASFQLFEAFSQQSSFPDHWTKDEASSLGGLIRTLLDHQREDNAMTVFSAMDRMGCPPNDVIFTILFKHFGEADNMGRFQELYKDFKRRNIRADVVAYTVLLSTAVKHGRLDIAQELMEKMKSSDIEPNNITWNTFLSGFVKFGKMDEALEIARKIMSLGMSSAVTTNIIIGGYRKQKDFTSALKFWKELDLDDPNNVDLVTYNIMLGIYSDQGDIAGAERIMQSLRTSPYAPNTISYNSLLNAYMYANDFEKVWALFDEIQARFRPREQDPITYRIMVQYLCRIQDLSRAKEILFPVLRANPRWPNDVWAPMLVLAARQSKEAAHTFIEELTNFQIKWDNIGYGTIIKVFTSHRNYAMADVWIAERRTSDYVGKDIQFAYNAILDSYAKRGDWKQMEQALQKMRDGRWLRSASDGKGGVSQCWKPDFVTWNVALNAYNLAGKFELAKQLWSRLWKSPAGTPPPLPVEKTKRVTALLDFYGVENVAVSIYLDILGFSNSARDIREFWADLMTSGFPCDLNNYTSYIEAMLRCGNIPAATHMLMQEMPRRGVDPDAKTLRNMLSLLEIMADAKRQTALEAESKVRQWASENHPELMEDALRDLSEVKEQLLTKQQIISQNRDENIVANSQG